MPPATAPAWAQQPLPSVGATGGGRAAGAQRHARTARSPGLRFVDAGRGLPRASASAGTFSHVDYLRKATRMPSPSRSHRSQPAPRTPSFAAPTGRLRSSRGLGRAAFESQARAQSDLEDVIKGTDHLRDIRRQYEQLASNMRKAQTQSSRDNKRWQDRVSQSREDMRKKLDEARHHFARELHNDQVSIEREKLKRNRRLASGVAAQRQAWAEFEAVDWAARSKKMRLSDIPFPDRQNPLSLGRKPTAAERKAAYREATLRWHPDKFFARWAAFIAEGDKDRIAERVAETAQLVAESRGRNG